MLQVKLREAMEAYHKRTGERITYERLAEMTGLSRATVESLGTRQTYNPRLSTVAKVCAALECQPGDLLKLVSETDRDAAQN